jgi:hypothetical protein
MPALAQLRGLMSREELRGLVARLRPTVPALARLARGNIELFTQQRAFSSCFNEVIIPWSNTTVEPIDIDDVIVPGPDAPTGLYPLEVGGRTFEETAYGFTGSASESRSGDAMGQHLRVLGGGGTNLIRFEGTSPTNEVFGLTPFPVLGAIPRLHGDSRKTEFRPDVACETQEPPNLEAGIGAPPDQQPVRRSSLADLDGVGAERLRELLSTLEGDGLSELAGLAPALRRREIETTQRLVDQLGFAEIDVAALVEEASR